MNLQIFDVWHHYFCNFQIDEDDEAIARVKPLKYAYEKEIVMYAHFKKLVYFSTECIFAPNAYRGHARAFLVFKFDSFSWRQIISPNCLYIYRKIWRKCVRLWLWILFTPESRSNSNQLSRSQFVESATDVVSYHHSSRVKRAFYSRAWIVVYRNWELANVHVPTEW